MSNEAELGAGLYALGAIEGEERRLFEAELARDPALRAEIERWQTQLAALEPASLELAPDPGSWSAVAHRLGFSAEGARTVYQGSKIWVAFGPGMEIKYLQVDPVSAERTALVRVQPGSGCPPHFHEQTEHCIVLDGAVELDGHALAGGDLHITPAGSDQGSFTSKEGALLLLRWAAKAAA